MVEFKLSNKVDPNKIFILKTSELEKRLDPFYYIPELKELEEKVREKDVKPLRYFVESVSSGATPKTEEIEKYYSDKENGIAFLRVQNLSPTGILDYEDCKYINKETHEGYLKRSQVKGGDLLVKITGVGRMAVASVAPDGFVGNTNQHMVVIKTGSKEISTVLASYLNSDIGEKLASRRATGGTRPALDYPALLSIPILFDERILEITEKAVEEKNKKEVQAKELLASIDDYLLDELGIQLPEKNNSLKNRIFMTSITEINGGRFDTYHSNPYFNMITESLKQSYFDLIPLNQISKKINRRFCPIEGKEYKYIQLGSIGQNSSEVIKPRTITLPEIPSRAQQVIKNGEILFSIANPQWGVHILADEKIENYAASSGFVMISANSNIVSEYLIEILRMPIYCDLYNKYLTGAGLFLNISETDLFKIKFPIPSKEKQAEIANHITDFRIQAKQLKTDAKEIMTEAIAEVENIILGE